MKFDSTTAIRLLTMTSLAGLLFTVGLRLTWREIVNSLRRCRFAWLLPSNFLLPPALTLALARVFHIPDNIAAGMMLLAAAPFAPVVPIFTRMARGDLALAGALTAAFPFVCAFLTPLVCEAGLKILLGRASLTFSVWTVLLALVSTITLPLAAGVVFRHWLPAAGHKWLKPLEVISEAAGAISLAFVTIVEFHAILGTGWMPLLAMAIGSEILFIAGFALGGTTAGARRVVAFGTSNRNIALALLVALESFPDTPIVPAVVANGLLLIFLGLLHVAFWHFRSPDPDRPSK